VETAWAGALTPATAADAYAKFKQAKVLVKRMEAIIYAYAKEHPIDLGNGKVFGERETRGNEKLDGSTVYAQFVRMFGHTIADAATKKTSTKTSIRAALRLANDERPLAVLEREMLQAIREAGGSTRTASTRIDEHEETT